MWIHTSEKDFYDSKLCDMSKDGYMDVPETNQLALVYCNIIVWTTSSLVWKISIIRNNKIKIYDMQLVTCK